MATLSTTDLNWLAREWEDSYGTAVLSGIVGDLAHKARGGYHISRQDQGSGNYSVKRPDDKLGPSDRAAAIDMTMSTADIIKCHKRLREIFKNRSKDTRMKYINGWNGWDGQGSAGRYDVVTGNIGTATADHKWHIHLEIRRRYVNDRKAMEAILSMLQGESFEDYTGTTVVKPVTKPTPVPQKPAEGELDMTKAELLEVLTAWAQSEAGRRAIAQAVGATDDVFNTPENFIGADGQPIYKTNPFLTLKDLVKRTAVVAAATAENVKAINAKIDRLSAPPSNPPPA